MAVMVVAKRIDPKNNTRKLIVKRSQRALYIEYYAGNIERQDTPPQELSVGGV